MYTLLALWRKERVGDGGWGTCHGPVCQCQFLVAPEPVVYTWNEATHDQHHYAQVVKFIPELGDRVRVV